MPVTDETTSLEPSVAPIKIDPDATYAKAGLAAVLNVSPRAIERWLKTRGRDKFPRPFYIGRTPYWRGKVVLNWFENRQSEALA